MEKQIENRYDIVLLFDVQDGNPNGDPDAGNLPRVDAETGLGLVTDVCLKRKMRNYVQLVKGCVKPYDIFIKERVYLNDLIDEPHELDEIKSIKEKDKKEDAARNWMCKSYYDVRSFGAVMTTGKKAGQVRGPIQFTFARSIDPIMILNNTLTRVAKTKEDKKEKNTKEENEASDSSVSVGTMAPKHTVPYGLYRAHGFISANLAKQTGFDVDDLELLKEALVNMFEHDRSAARGLMSTQKCFLFKHVSALGNAPSHKLFDLIKVSKKEGVDVPRSFADYDVVIDKDNLPSGVELISLI